MEWASRFPGTRFALNLIKVYTSRLTGAKVSGIVSMVVSRNP